MNSLPQKHALLYSFRYFEVFYMGSKTHVETVFLFNEFQNYPVDLSIWKRGFFLCFK